VRRIEGSQSGIMGLPLYETALVLGLRRTTHQR
jgi:predicted house-cleaning NTP pyrophosphatase (Maf/HAM1 superfamily)